jgi:hypothetical protein
MLLLLLLLLLLLQLLVGHCSLKIVFGSTPTLYRKELKASSTRPRYARTTGRMWQRMCPLGPNFLDRAWALRDWMLDASNHLYYLFGREHGSNLCPFVFFSLPKWPKVFAELFLFFLLHCKNHSIFLITSRYYYFGCANNGFILKVKQVCKVVLFLYKRQLLS